MIRRREDLRTALQYLKACHARQEQPVHPVFNPVPSQSTPRRLLGPRTLIRLAQCYPHGSEGQCVTKHTTKRYITVNNVYIKPCKLDSLWQNVLESSNDNTIMNVQDREGYSKFSDLHGTSIFPHIQTSRKTLF